MTTRASNPTPTAPLAAVHARPIGVREELDEMKRTGVLVLWLRSAMQNTPGWTASLIVHAVLLILLALITIIPEIDHVIPSLQATNDKEVEVIKDIDAPVITPNIDVDPSAVAVAVAIPIEDPVPAPAGPIVMGPDLPNPQIALETSEMGDPSFRKNLLSRPGRSSGGIMDGRNGNMMGVLKSESGWTPDCDVAVGHALKWLAAHQMQNGGWSFHHGQQNGHIGPVNDPGSENSTTAATSLAILPFLGAGATHKEGKYQEVVQRGLYALLREGKLSPQGLDLRGGGSMYAHGLSAIVLCEAYAMTKDKHLAQPAQQAIDFIVNAQDMTGGGWRYTPGQPGDTSVVGWQLMALKSGHLAYLKVPQKSVAGVINFLDLVQSNNGANYGYTSSGAGPSTTAVGLLCRMYLGWKKTNPALEGGVRYLSQQGPAKNNIYFNYYAAQVLRHWEGDEWRKWEKVMREQLLSTQVQAGTYSSDKGSWYTPGQSHGERGGRIYETSLSCMTLEVYYRNMPLYRKAAAEAGDDF